MSNWLYVGQKGDKIGAMRKEARDLLDKAEAILNKPNVTDADASRATLYQEKASRIIDRASKLMDVLAADAQLELEEAKKGNGKGVGMDKKNLDNHGFKDFGEFLRAVIDCNKGYRDSRLVKDSKDMSEGSGTAGGYLVPPEFNAEVQQIEGEQSIVAPRATVFPMTSRSLQVPLLDQSGSAAGAKSNFWGMLEFEWGEEAADKPELSPRLKQLELVCHKAVGWCPVSDEFLEDAPNAGAFLSREFAGGMADFLDYHYLQGNGAGQPLGIVGAPGTFTQVRTLANNFTYADACNMLLHFHGKRGVWVMHKTVLTEMLTMADPLGNYVWVPGSTGVVGTGVAGPVPGTLFGYPVIFTENLPTLGTTGDVLLCNFRWYFIGRRIGISVESSIHERFRKDQTSFRVRTRVDGQPALPAPIYLKDGVTQVSPFVELDASTP